jgi:hypothetical protein
MSIAFAAENFKIKPTYRIFIEIFRRVCNPLNLMMIRYDPYQVFRSSKTPAGLYARQKWLGESENQQWKIDFKETVSALSANQLSNGSWDHDPVATIRHLFGLHLTVRSTTEGIDAALSWLLEKIDLQNQRIRVNGEDAAIEDDLTGLPFIPSRQDMFITGAGLFLASIFGREDDPTVLSIYRQLSVEGKKNKGRWIDRASSHNIFRAMVVHPIFARDKATALAVENIADIIDEQGHWGSNVTFYQTLNALAHLSFSQVEPLLEKAFARLIESQNKDGSWSRSQPEWNTFLAVHALKNKGLL